MGTRPYPVPPLLTLSTSAFPPLRASTWFRIAHEAGLNGIDLDLSGRPLPEPGRLLAIARRSDVPIRSIWVPRAGVWTGWRVEHGMEAAAALANVTEAGCVVIEAPPPATGVFAPAALTGRADALRALVTARTRVVVTLRSRHLEGGRRHLVQMTALRRLAEEWEFDLALDLVGAIDPRWEAEAVVSRLGSRLTMLRLDGDVFAGVGLARHRAPVRALAAAIDGGHAARFAIVPRVPIWQAGRASALARSGAEARRRISDRYSAVEEQRMLDVFPHPRPGQRS
jgi:hypothetical protein